MEAEETPGQEAAAEAAPKKKKKGKLGKILMSVRDELRAKSGSDAS